MADNSQVEFSFLSLESFRKLDTSALYYCQELFHDICRSSQLIKIAFTLAKPSLQSLEKRASTPTVVMKMNNVLEQNIVFERGNDNQTRFY